MKFLYLLAISALAVVSASGQAISRTEFQATNSIFRTAIANVGSPTGGVSAASATNIADAVSKANIANTNTALQTQLGGKVATASGIGTNLTSSGRLYVPAGTNSAAGILIDNYWAFFGSTGARLWVENTDNGEKPIIIEANNDVSFKGVLTASNNVTIIGTNVNAVNLLSNGSPVNLIGQNASGVFFKTAIPAGGAANIATNGNQFGANTTLTLKDGVLTTNLVNNGTLNNSGTITGAVLTATSGNFAGTVTGATVVATTANVSGTITGATVTATSGNFSGTVTGATVNATTANAATVNSATALNASAATFTNTATHNGTTVFNGTNVIAGAFARTPVKSGNGTLAFADDNYFTIATNASFTLTLSGTATNGHQIAVAVSNYNASSITITSSPSFYDQSSSMATNLFSVPGASKVSFDLVFDTNFVAAGEWRIVNFEGPQFQLAAGANVTFTTNGLVITIASSGTGSGITATNGNTFGANTTLNIKDGGYVTNLNHFGTFQSVASYVTNVLTASNVISTAWAQLVTNRVSGWEFAAGLNSTNTVTGSNFVATAGGTNVFGATQVTNAVGVPLIVRGPGGSNAAVGGLVYLTTSLFTNLGTAPATLTNAGNVVIAGHTLTNNGDSIVAEWHIAMPAAAANTNQFKIVLGSTTLLDTGLITGSNGPAFLKTVITRTGNTSQLVWSELRTYAPMAGQMLSASTNVNIVTAETNGINTTLALQIASRIAGGATNNFFSVKYEPASY